MGISGKTIVDVDITVSLTEQMIDWIFLVASDLNPEKLPDEMLEIIDTLRRAIIAKLKESK